MPWSRLRKQIEERVAPALGGRVSIHQARYRHANEELGRIWIAVDGREVAAFATGARWRRVREGADRLMDERNAWGSPAAYEQAVVEVVAALREEGHYDDDDALSELEAFLSIPVATALESPSPLLRALAMLDGRVGKRRLRALLAAPPDHALVRALLALRCAAEGVRPAPPA